MRLPTSIQNRALRALDQILALCPSAEGLRTRRAIEVGSPILVHRYERTLQEAMGQLPEEIAQEAVEALNELRDATEGKSGPKTRANEFRVPVEFTAAEYAAFEAARGERSKSGFIREALAAYVDGWPVEG